MVFEGCPVELWMEQILLEDEEIEERTHYCKVMEYDEMKEQLTMMLRGEEVSVISLDVIYGCKIMDGERYAKCQGRVLERYLSKQGNMIVFQVEDGFYKNTVK